MKKLKGMPDFDDVKKRWEDICDTLDYVEKQKLETKKQCIHIHGVSLSKLIKADIAIAANKLTDYRRTQLALAHDYQVAVSDAEKSQLRAKINQISMKKKILKKKIQTDYHTKLSQHESAKDVVSFHKYLSS